MDFSMWVAPFKAVAADFIHFAPKITGALAVLAVGLFFSWLIQLFVQMIFRILKLDVKLSDVWFFRLWSKSMHGQKPSKAFSRFFYYFFLFIFVLIAIKILGGDASDRILESLLGLLPHVFSFMLILFLGFILAMFFSIIAQIILVGADAKYPNFWGKVIAWGTFGVAVLFSLEELGIAGRFVSAVFLVILCSAGLAAAIALGIGCKDLAREFVIELLKKSKGDRNE